MNIDTFLDLFGQYGYFLLLFHFSLGIIGLPMNDEVIIMSVGVATAHGIMNTPLSFILLYLGVLSGFTVGYVVGRFAGSKVLNFLSRKPRFKRGIERSQKLVDKYGNYSLIIACFIPLLRHIVPYIVGMNKMPFKQYMIYTYGVGFIWLVIYFSIGYFFGEYIDVVFHFITNYKVVLFGIGLSVVALVYFLKYKKEVKVVGQVNVRK